MMRFIRFTFGVTAYVFFFATFLYLIGFMTNQFVPRSINVGTITMGPVMALLVNLILLSLFAVQHSVMARPAFKSALTRILPAAIERSFYVATTAMVLCVLFWFWQPMPEPVWSVANDALRTAIWVICGLGWGIVLLSTFLINHFELFGLQQIWSDLRNHPQPASTFRQPLFYRLVRHPIYTGFLLAFWFTPDMSQGHLLFAVGMTVYIFVGIRYEEADLRANLGEDYVAYSSRVGKVIPGVGKVKL